MNEPMKYTLRRFFYGIYTLLCAVLRERWGKPHAGRMCVAPLAWLVQRSNIAHNVRYLLSWRLLQMNFDLKNRTEF
jgi:hypothetical protein